MEQEQNNAEEIRKKFSALPAEIKNMAYSSEMMEIIKQVADKNQLHIDKIEPLEGEAIDVMTGYTAPRDLVASLADSLEIDQIKAEAIAKDLNELLFSKIRDSMKQAGLSADTTPAPSNPPAMSAPAAVLEEKSVVMPSSVAKAPLSPTAPAPVAAVPVPPAPTPSISPAPVKPLLPNMAHIDAMLTQPTVSIASKTPPAPAKTEPPKPGPIYKTDPYHEPID